jgi:hypothetical protein
MSPSDSRASSPRTISTRRPILKRAGIILAALLLLAVIFEMTLRFGLGLGRPVLIAPDAACEYILKPNQNLTRFFDHTYVNSYGMRSDPIPAIRNPHVLRIMFVGDSITYGTSQVDQSRIFTQILKRDLPSIVHRPVEVLNASAGAWAIDNELSYIRSRGIFQSDWVILVLNSGDMTQPRSTLQQVGDGLSQHNFATAAGELYTRWLRPRLFAHIEHQDAGDSAQPNADQTVMNNLSDLDRFQGLVSGRHAHMAIIYLPFRRDIPSASAPSLAALQQWTTVHHVPLVDLTPVESPYSAQEITLDHGAHLNARGNLVIAKAIETQWEKAITP